MADASHRIIETNGIRMHIAEAGQGPLVVLLHGFPESWYSWRHQLMALAEAGYHVVAPDQRGYGQTERPSRIEQYTQLHLVGDIIGLLDALGEQQAVIVGHDWGAILAWDVALLRPDRVRVVSALSVPYWPRGSVSILTALQAALGDDFYMVHFQQPGLAETEFESDVRATLRNLLYASSGDASQLDLKQSTIPASETLPAWLTEQDLDYYTSMFERTGFTGALNWYRTIDKSWELMAAWNNAPILPPALYIAGERDLVLNFPGSRERIANMRSVVPHLKETLILPGCGHWTQQERPAEVNAALIEFIRALPSS